MQNRSKISLSLALILIVAFGFFYGCRKKAPTGIIGKRLEVYAIDVGQGDSLLIMTPEGKTVLIDAGLNKSGERVVQFLRERNVGQLDLIIASHPHADHIGGVRDVLKAFPVKNFLDSGQEHTTVTYTKMLEAVKERIGKLTVAKSGQKFTLDNGITLSILGPRQPWLANVTGSDINANSVIVRLDYGKFSMLFTGDSEDETEDRLIGDGANLKVQVLKVAHHGSRYATTERFLKYVQPEAAIISCGADNDYGHPTQATLDRLRRFGVKLYRTDLQGDVKIASNGETYQITESRAPASDLWAGRRPAGKDDVGGGADLFNNTPQGQRAKRAALGGR